MHKYMLATLVAFALVLSSCSESSQPNAPQKTPSVSTKAANSDWMEWNTLIWNPCCDEYITITAKYHLVTKSDGGYKINMAKLVGSGSTGSTYHGNVGAKFVTNEDGTWRYKEHWVLSTADGCSFQYVFEYHLEYDEFGNPQFIVDKSEIICD